MITEASDGLSQKWDGLVYCNPPYGRKLGVWLERCADHGSAIALVFARTDTAAFHLHVWPKASAMLFIKGRLTFHYPDGSAPRTGHNSGGPSVLIAYGHEAAKRLYQNRDLGAYVAFPESLNP